MKKDGQAFEKQVLQRNDNRFSFLQPGDNYYQYYKWRRDQLFPPAKEVNTLSAFRQRISVNEMAR